MKACILKTFLIPFPFSRRVFLWKLPGLTVFQMVLKMAGTALLREKKQIQLRRAEAIVIRFQSQFHEDKTRHTHKREEEKTAKMENEVTVSGIKSNVQPHNW